MNKIFSIASTVLATVVMGTALVYYNFIDKKKANIIKHKRFSEIKQYIVGV
jgi:hypothetical protein